MLENRQAATLLVCSHDLIHLSVIKVIELFKKIRRNSANYR